MALKHRPMQRLNLQALQHLNDKYLSGYRYSTKRDIILDQVATVMDASGLTHRDIARDAEVSPTTLYSWTHGKTRRPQNATVETVLRACGYARKIVPLTNGTKE